MERRDLNARVLAHVIGENSKVALEAYVKLSVNGHEGSLSDDISVRHHSSEPFRDSCTCFDEQVDKDDSLLYLKPRSEGRDAVKSMFAATAAMFANISTALKKCCCSPKRWISRKRRMYAKASSDEEGSLSFLGMADMAAPGAGPSYASMEPQGKQWRVSQEVYYDQLEGPQQLDEAAWVAFRRNITKTLVSNLKFKPYVRIREGLFCMSSEVLRTVKNRGMPNNTVVKVTVCDDALDTADVIVDLLCNKILRAANGITRVQCSVAENDSDLVMVECDTEMKPHEDACLLCRCPGAKLRKHTKGYDFNVWEPRSTSDLCSRCQFKEVTPEFTFHEHIGAVVSTADPLMHENDIKKCDFLLPPSEELARGNRNAEEDRSSGDLHKLSCLLSHMSDVKKILMFSIWRTNGMMLLTLVLLFLPIVIISITPAREQAEILAAGLAYIPAMLAALFTLVTVAPERFLKKLGRRFLYKEVRTFEQVKTMLGMAEGGYSDEQWRKALMNMTHGKFNLQKFGGPYSVSNDHTCFPLGDWCKMTLQELQSYTSGSLVLPNRERKVMLMVSSGTVQLFPIVPRGDYLHIDRDSNLRNVRCSELAGADDTKVLS